jgi:hypothetical protein
MMEQRGRQLDLLAFTRRAVQHQRLDPMRLEVTVLLKLLLNECSAARANVQEANDKQDNA